MFNESKEPKGKIFAEFLVIFDILSAFYFKVKWLFTSLLLSFPVFSFLYCLKEKELTLAANLPI